MAATKFNRTSSATAAGSGNSHALGGKPVVSNVEQGSTTAGGMKGEKDRKSVRIDINSYTSVGVSVGVGTTVSILFTPSLTPPQQPPLSLLLHTVTTSLFTPLHPILSPLSHPLPTPLFTLPFHPYHLFTPLLSSPLVLPPPLPPAHTPSFPSPHSTRRSYSAINQPRTPRCRPITTTRWRYSTTRHLHHKVLSLSYF